MCIQLDCSWTMLRSPGFLRLVVVLATVLGLANRIGAEQPKLRFKEDGTFTIVEFTDLHYGESKEKDMFTDEVRMCVWRVTEMVQSLVL